MINCMQVLRFSVVPLTGDGHEQAFLVFDSVVSVRLAASNGGRNGRRKKIRILV